MDEPMIEVWVTKYALSGKGIKQSTARRTSGDYVKIGTEWNFLKIGRGVYFTRAEAVVAANAARATKIDSLRGQIAKLEKMDFSA